MENANALAPPPSRGSVVPHGAAEGPPSPSPGFQTSKLPNKASRTAKPRLFLMGLRRSGKSSISSVVFHKMPPTETLFLESTSRIQKDSMNSFMDFQVWDFPGQVDFLDPAWDVHNIFGEPGALIYVIDAQDEYLDAIIHLNSTILHLQQHFPCINIEVFIHKVDGLSDDFKLDTQREIVQRVQDELSDAGFENAPVSFHLTSIYDHSIFEAFSKVVQKLITQLPSLEGLLNLLSHNCKFEKAYLFDVMSKIYVATDTTPVDMSAYEICSDYIDMVVDMSEIYAWDRPMRYLEDGTEDFDDTTNPDAESDITLLNGKALYLREINRYLALVGILREGAINHKNMIYVNHETFKTAVAQVFGFQRVEEKASRRRKQHAIANKNANSKVKPAITYEQ